MMGKKIKRIYPKRWLCDWDIQKIIRSIDHSVNCETAMNKKDFGAKLQKTAVKARITVTVELL